LDTDPSQPRESPGSRSLSKVSASTSILETQHFEAWQLHLSQAIGHHRSTFLTPEIPFASRLEITRAGAVAVVSIQGQSSVRLHRTQPPDQGVLWLPQTGWVAEQVNGSPLLAEPGTAMLCLPGDDLLGDTSLQLRGVSILLPAALLGDPGSWCSCQRRHLHQGPEELALIQMARDLVGLLRRAGADPGFAVTALADQILYWRDIGLHSARDWMRPVDRRRLIARSREWIEAHLATPFRVTDLAAALHVSARSLQMAYREELGRPPMEEARRLRFLALRRLLLLPPAAHPSLEELFHRCGLASSSLIRRRYHQWCGETAEQTRTRASGPAR
jgi:AraC-like DNA-binding protein